MRLSVGGRLGPYQILGPLGSGGMGEVYRARDTKLNRDVAIKVLRADVANDPERLARFTREAQVLASLNHPHIAHIHGLDETGGLPALIMELVEGPTLEDRLSNGALPLGESLSIARQIAEALAAAHDQGIVHRDLKPANIKLRSDGTVKLLDFGLAKAFDPSGVLSADAESAATITSPALTRLGVILGTAAYMSPEQARGRSVDKRSDIWAFGCVLYEMLTARRAFPGETISDSIAAVLEKTPDWSRLPQAAPSSIRRLLERALEKDPSRRLHDIADARIEIDDAMAGKDAAPAVIPSGRQSMAWRAAALGLAAIATLFAYLALSRRGPDTGGDRFLPFASERQQQLSPAWSPDGRSVAYVASSDDVRQLFVKTLDAAVPTQLTRSAGDCQSPFWSPDGTQIYYLAEQKLWSVGAAGGQPQLVMDDVAVAAIAADRTIAFLRGAGGKQTLWIAPPSGTPAPYRSAPFPDQFTRSNSVGFSRDGTKLAVLIEQQAGPELTFELWILPFPQGTPRRALGPFQSPTNPFDFGRISWTPDNRHLILQNTPPDEQSWHLYLVDTDSGSTQIITSGTGTEWTPAVSPDGQRVAFASGSPDFDIVQVSIDNGETRSVLATGRNETSPAWSPSGTRFAFVTNAHGRPELWLHNVQDDSSSPVLRRGMEGVPAWSGLQWATFSPDGQKIVYGSIQSNRHAIWVSSVAGGQPVPIDHDSVDQHGASWSPDGNSIAYQRLHDGQWELVKAPLGGGPIVRIAPGSPGAGETAWSPTGAWLAYVRGGALHLVAPDGSADKALSTPVPAAFAFSRDGTLVYALHRSTDHSWNLASIDVQSGESRKVQALKIPGTDTVTSISLHPDGRSFITAVGTFRLDLWLLERGIPPTPWWRSILRSS